MDLKFARTETDQQANNVDLATIEESVEKEDSIIFYFDKDNSHKDLVELVEHFEAKDISIYFREVKSMYF